MTFLKNGNLWFGGNIKEPSERAVFLFIIFLFWFDYFFESSMFARENNTDDIND